MAKQQPFYHLRPNKSIDRILFLQTLMALGQLYPIPKYKYTGFGSYLFDDFKLLHDTLNIAQMVSLEKDPEEFKRAQYNLPYNCIDVRNIDSTEYLSQLVLDEDSKNIFWLDFVTPSELGAQLADYSTLLNILNPGDVVRITLNSNPAALPIALDAKKDPPKLQENRLKKLREQVPEEYFPVDATAGDMTHERYPLLLLGILKLLTMHVLEDNPPYSPNFLLPLFSTIYADGQQMLTFTGLILDSHDKERSIKNALEAYPHNNFEWNRPSRIQIPPLSVREINEINRMLPGEERKQEILRKFSFIFPKDDQGLDSYISYYKYYPNYHQVSF